MYFTIIQLTMPRIGFYSKFSELWNPFRHTRRFSLLVNFYLLGCNSSNFCKCLDFLGRRLLVYNSLWLTNLKDMDIIGYSYYSSRAPVTTGTPVSSPSSSSPSTTATSSPRSPVDIWPRSSARSCCSAPGCSSRPSCVS